MGKVKFQQFGLLQDSLRPHQEWSESCESEQLRAVAPPRQCPLARWSPIVKGMAQKPENERVILDPPVQPSHPPNFQLTWMNAYLSHLGLATSIKVHSSV